MTREWLDSLKPGDEVYVSKSHGPGRIAKVERTTATRIVLENGTAVMKRNGKVVGCSDWDIFFIYEPTEKHRMDIRIVEAVGRIVRKCGEHQLKRMPIETLEAIAGMLEPTST